MEIIRKIINTFLGLEQELFYYKQGTCSDREDERDWDADEEQPLAWKKPVRQKYSIIYTQDQKNTPWCVGYTAAGTASMMCRRELRKSVTVEGEEVAKMMLAKGTMTKNGADIRAGMEAICEDGIRIKGTNKYFQPRGYAKIPKTVDAFKQRMMNGQPIITGALINRPMVTLKDKIFKPWLGGTRRGHAFCSSMGWDDGREVFVFNNSWGDKWGNKGTFYVRYDELNSLMSCYVFLTDQQFIHKNGE